MAGVTDRIVQLAQLALTQGSADAFVTGQIATGISTGARFGWLIDRVEFVVGVGIAAAPQTADCEFSAQLGQGAAPAALYSSVSTDLICERRVALPGIAAAVNAYAIELAWSWKAPDNYVVVDPLLNVAFDSTATAVANTLATRVYYYPIAITELDILRLIALR